MEVSRVEFPAPVLVLDEFLTKEDAAACLQECIALEPVFVPGTVGQGKENRQDARWRKNDVVVMHDVFRAAPSRSKLISLLDKRVMSAECNTLWHKDYTIFDAINYSNWKEMVLSRYGKCDFYGKHRDTKSNPDNKDEIRHRIVTLILYLNVEPEHFTGGELTLHEAGAKVTIPPHHNRAVVFPSYTFHEVGSVALPPDAPHAWGRFSVNYWFGFR